MQKRKSRGLGRKDRDKSAEVPESAHADREQDESLEQIGVEQRPDTGTEGLAERWRASHEEWRQRMRSQNG